MLPFLTIEIFSVILVLFLYTVATVGGPVTFTLNVEIDPLEMPVLKGSQYNLCVAKKVNGVYNVVWSGQQDYLENNEFQWQESYQVLGTNTFTVCLCLYFLSI